METDLLRDLEVVRTWDLAVRADEPTADASLGVMEVRFSRFNTWYEINSWWEGRFLERTAPGAFKRTITAHHQRVKKNSSDGVKVLFNHGFDFQIGDKLLGGIDSLAEETDSPVGLVTLDDTSYNRDLLPGLRRGGYGSSFMFRVIKDAWDQEPGVSDDNPEGLPERTIKEVRLYEFGPVTWPANPDASAGLRCTSGTDAYYEKLRGRDPQRVDALRARFAAHRTPNTGPAESTPADGPAPSTTDDPAIRHSIGLSAGARRNALHPFLTAGSRS